MPQSRRLASAAAGTSREPRGAQAAHLTSGGEAARAVAPYQPPMMSKITSSPARMHHELEQYLLQPMNRLTRFTVVDRLRQMENDGGVKVADAARRVVRALKDGSRKDITAAQALIDVALLQGFVVATETGRLELAARGRVFLRAGRESRMGVWRLNLARGIDASVRMVEYEESKDDVEFLDPRRRESGRRKHEPARAATTSHWSPARVMA